MKVPVPSFDLLPRVGAAFSQSAGEDVWLKVCLVVVVGVGVCVGVGVGVGVDVGVGVIIFLQENVGG